MRQTLKYQSERVCLLKSEGKSEVRFPWGGGRGDLGIFMLEEISSPSAF